MKFNFLSLKKQSFTFELSQLLNVEAADIKDAAQLISWVEEENARILDEDSEGSLLVVKRGKKNRPLYAQFIEFPMAMDTDFDTLLEPFYTKKPITFDQSLLDAPKAPVIPPPPIPKTPVQAPPAVSEAKPVQDNSEEIKQLLAAQKEQQKEIERLRLQLEEATQQQTVPAPVEAPPAAPVQAAAAEVMPAAAPAVNKTEENVFDNPALSFQERLDLFIEQEKKKIEDEIAVTDNRLLIEPEIRARVEEEREQAISRLEIDLFEKKAAAIAEEEKRHAEELETITQKFEKQIQAKTGVLNDKYQQKAAKEIREEYDRQTKELKRIFNERMAELKKRQSDMGNKLMADIQASFSELDLTADIPGESEKKPYPQITELRALSTTG